MLLAAARDPPRAGILLQSQGTRPLSWATASRAVRLLSAIELYMTTPLPDLGCSSQGRHRRRPATAAARRCATTSWREAACDHHRLRLLNDGGYGKFDEPSATLKNTGPCSNAAEKAGVRSPDLAQTPSRSATGVRRRRLHRNAEEFLRSLASSSAKPPVPFRGLSTP